MLLFLALWNLDEAYYLTFLYLQMTNDQVTEQAHLAIEARFKEADEQQRKLEEKLLEAEKVKKTLEEQNRKALESMEEQVYWHLPILNNYKYCSFVVHLWLPL